MCTYENSHAYVIYISSINYAMRGESATHPGEDPRLGKQAIRKKQEFWRKFSGDWSLAITVIAVFLLFYLPIFAPRSSKNPRPLRPSPFLGISYLQNCERSTLRVS